uniref:Uncharacterized protein n=1 Tax=Aegilops tauschii subsp. strangulata TaxID=200361 RepID=A0A453NAG9_AEGTS
MIRYLLSSIFYCAHVSILIQGTGSFYFVDQVLHGSAVDSITITTLMVQAQLTTSFLVGL